MLQLSPMIDNDSFRPESSTDDEVASDEPPPEEPNYYQPPEIYAIPTCFNEMNWRSKSTQNVKILPCDFDAIENRPLNDRHSAHYFSNINLFTDSGYNYLKYAKYKELQSEGQRKHPPYLNVLRTSFALDSRTTLDRACLRLPHRIPVLREVSFDLSAGDIMALLYTSDYEMRTLLRVIAGSAKGKIGGELFLNGKKQTQDQMAARIELVKSEQLMSSLTVEQYLSIKSGFRPPPKNRRPRIGAVLASLALSRVRKKLISKLGKTEKQRVKIAAEVLRDTDILLCENITEIMDVYDVGFIIDYLRNWAIRHKRIVILAIAPSSIEMLQMFSKVLILASGRLTYFGPPEDMIPYFESINFPCPPFKNPCDYYVDLATHDHLSEDASRASLRRISSLCAEWAQKERLPSVPSVSSLPPMAGRPGFLKSIGVLYRKYCFHTLNNPLDAFSEPILCLLLSGAISTLFSNFPVNKRGTADDRLGIVVTLTFLTFFSLIFLWISIANRWKDEFVTDRKTGFYGSIVYYLTNILFDTPIVLISATCLYTPIVFLTEILRNSTELSAIFAFVIPLSIYYMTLRVLIFGISHLFSNRSSSFICSVLLMVILFLLSGLPISFQDLPEYVRTIAVYTPTYWTAQLILQQQFLGTSVVELLLFNVTKANELLIGCEKKQVLARKIGDTPIYGVTQCSKFRGSQLLSFFGFDSSAILTIFPILIVCSWMIVSHLFLLISMVFSKRRKTKK